MFAHPVVNHNQSSFFVIPMFLVHFPNELTRDAINFGPTFYSAEAENAVIALVLIVWTMWH